MVNNIIEYTIKTLMVLLFMIALFTLGWNSKGMYEAYKNERTLNGLYFEYGDYEFVNKVSKTMDDKGDWVCINVAYDMTYEEAFDTCVHECGHKAFSEIFAEKCDEDLNKCKDMIQG